MTGLGTAEAESVLVTASADRALTFVTAMQRARPMWLSSQLTPDDPAFGRMSVGIWAGMFTMPNNTINAAIAEPPILLRGPLWFPIIAGQEVTFAGEADIPWASLDGFAGIRYINGDPAQGVDPASAYNESETVSNWGTYYVVGVCNGALQFRARIGPARYWSAVVANPPSGSGWTFQIVTYTTAADDAADRNRRAIGGAWNQTDHPGDVRAYWTHRYTPPLGPLFTNVTNLASGAEMLFSGDIIPGRWAPRAGYHYRVVLTEETDTEYVQLLLDVDARGHFEQLHGLTFTGGLKLRLVEVNDLTHAPERHIGPVWDQFGTGTTVFPDLRIEYFSIDTSIPPFPTRTAPAALNRSWAITHTTGTTGEVRLVDTNNKRVCGALVMPTGLARSYNVPASQAGQSTDSVYYDGFMDTCFLYDQAVVLIALIQQGEWAAARMLIDALLLVQNDDGSFPFAKTQSLLGGNDYFLLRTGVVAWVAYALLIADQPEFRSYWTTRTDAAATTALAWVIDNTLNSVGLFRGGFDSNGQTPWWSTEHNLDLWWAFDLADRLYGSAATNWRGYADGIKSALLTYGWDAADGIFWQGGGHTDDTQNDGAHAFDMHSWGGTALEKWGQPADRDHAIARGYGKYWVTDDVNHLSGFTTFIPEDGYPAGTVKSPWCEGTFGMCLTLRNSDPKRAHGLIATMARGQLADGSYHYTLRRDPIQPIETFPSLIGAAWNVLALSGAETINPRIIWT